MEKVENGKDRKFHILRAYRSKMAKWLHSFYKVPNEPLMASEFIWVSMILVLLKLISPLINFRFFQFGYFLLGLFVLKPELHMVEKSRGRIKNWSSLSRGPTHFQCKN